MFSTSKISIFSYSNFIKLPVFNYPSMCYFCTNFSYSSTCKKLFCFIFYYYFIRTLSSSKSFFHFIFISCCLVCILEYLIFICVNSRESYFLYFLFSMFLNYFPNKIKNCIIMLNKNIYLLFRKLLIRNSISRDFFQLYIQYFSF